MKPSRKLVISLLVAAAVWTVFAWPLPRYLTSGIPLAARKHLPVDARTMVAGDHLQLHYNFWLLKDMLFGETPLLYDVYEFNSGDDTETYRPKAYYLPFSFVYALLSFGVGNAAAWNITGFLTMWLTFFCAWRLAARYSETEWVPCVAALIAITLPIHWHYLCGGSPTGYSMMWIPILWYGLDRAVRDESRAGGLIAGIALFGACICDLQASFLAVLSVPFWCVVAFIKRTNFKWRDPAAYRGILMALAPFVLSGIPIGWYAAMRKKNMAGTALSDERGIAEVALFSPSWEGLFSPKTLDITNQIFIGVTLTLVLLAGLILAIVAIKKHGRSKIRNLIVYAMLALAGLTIIGLALGMNGPFNDLLFRFARKYIPMYDKIRQPAKIYCLMPALLTVMGALALTSFCALSARRRVAVCIGVLTAGILIEAKNHVRPAICLLDTEQAAYAAIARDAAQRGVQPRAIAVPLWPGDSAWSSIYQHYATLYRIRFVNGYHPATKKKYFINTFRFLQSINQGMLNAEQRERLADQGVDYVVFHENAFARKVSPFAGAFTLERLLNHPHLELRAQSDGIWAFALRREPDPTPVWDGVGVFFPGRRWEAEHVPNRNAIRDTEESCVQGAFARLKGGHSSYLEPRRVRTGFAPNMQFLVRARYTERIKAIVTVDREPNHEDEYPSGSTNWGWLRIPVAEYDRYRKLKLEIHDAGATADVDTILITAGEMNSDGKSLTFPGAAFFHWGKTDIDNNACVLRRVRVNKHRVWRGFGLPLPAGVYSVDLETTSPAPVGTTLAMLRVEGDGLRERASAPILSGEPTSVSIVQNHDLPVELVVEFHWQGDLTIKRATIRRETPHGG